MMVMMMAPGTGAQVMTQPSMHPLSQYNEFMNLKEGSGKGALRKVGTGNHSEQSRQTFYDELPQKFDKPREDSVGQAQGQFFKGEDDVGELASNYFSNSPVMQRIRYARDRFLEKQVCFMERRKTQDQGSAKPAGNARGQPLKQSLGAERAQLPLIVPQPASGAQQPGQPLRSSIKKDIGDLGEVPQRQLAGGKRKDESAN